MSSLPRARTVLAFVAIIGYIIITGSFFGLLFFGKHITLPAGDIGEKIIGMLGLVVGSWNAAMMMVLTFHFGTSQSSSEKNDIIKAALPKPDN